MTERAVKAYDLPQRVASYDADMDLMHPNRAVMVRVALDVMPFPPDAPLRALDLGAGTGYFTQRFLTRFPHSRVIAVDGAAAMVDLATARLRELADRVQFHTADFREIDALGLADASLDVAFSSYALHHLTRADKETVVRSVVRLLRPGGWFLNADLIVAGSEPMEERLQQLRIDGIVERAAGRDARFGDASATRRFLDSLQSNEGDQPMTIQEDLAILAGSGLRASTAFWLEYRELVSGGIR